MRDAERGREGRRGEAGQGGREAGGRGRQHAVHLRCRHNTYSMDTDFVPEAIELLQQVQASKLQGRKVRCSREACATQPVTAAHCLYGPGGICVQLAPCGDLGEVTGQLSRSVD